MQSENLKIKSRVAWLVRKQWHAALISVSVVSKSEVNASHSEGEDLLVLSQHL